MDLGFSPQHSLESKPDPGFQVIGPALRILQLNVEGLSAAKRTIISAIASEHKADVICLQETHIATSEAGKFTIMGFDLLSHSDHPKHGRATYIRSDVSSATHLSSTGFCDVLQIGDLQIANVYKPPGSHWDPLVLPTLHHPAVYVGDFNSHHQNWGYGSQNPDGEQLANWALNNDIYLLYDPKQRASFRSARWLREYSPDLCWVTSRNSRPLSATTRILEVFPHSQHRPTLVCVGVGMPIMECSKHLRWNLRKADWPAYSACLERSIVTIPSRIISIEESYSRFRGAIYKAAQSSIPRGRRPVYTPCWNDECSDLLKQYEQSGDPDIADHLLDSLDASRRSRWEEATSRMNFSRSSRKSWSLLRRLGAAQMPPVSRPRVTPNQIASHLIQSSRAPMNKAIKRQVHDEWRKFTTRNSNLSQVPTVTLLELDSAKSKLKPGSAAGYDNILPEFLQHLGPRARSWLVNLFTRILRERSLPKIWRRCKVIAILKPGKDPKEAASYRSISLLSVPFKLLERIILERISPVVEDILLPEQAGFRPGRSTCEQVLALTTFIENGFQEKLKTGAILLDLSSAYDTVWHKGLLVKLSRVLPPWATRAIELLTGERYLRVHLGDATSSWRRSLNGLPQGSVLAPTLFNIYIQDLPKTASRKFIYADDICLGAQSGSFSELNRILNSDLALLVEFCKTWRLTPNIKKTVSCLFHLNNARANQSLAVFLDGSPLRHVTDPPYLGVTLDRSLTFRPHLRNTAAKLRTRNNILNRLAGSTWGAGARTLRLSAIALCYSVAEYCAPVWQRSIHTDLIDTQLHSTMRIISGSLRASSTPWLTVLCNIAPPHIRRLTLSAHFLEKIRSNPDLPLYSDLFNHPGYRLPSRHPFWSKVYDPHETPASLWREEWSAMDVRNNFLIRDPTTELPGMDLPRRLWVSLNRFRTDHGQCAEDRFRWGLATSPLCQCGFNQSMFHIVEDCPISRFPGGLRSLHEADPAGRAWLSEQSNR